MSRLSMPAWLGRGLLQRRWATAAIALVLLAISLLLAWQRERVDTVQQADQVRVQAKILAGSLAGALAFDDADTMREHLDAFRLDPRIQAAGVYGSDGGLAAGFTKQGRELPARVSTHAPMRDGRHLVVVRPVQQRTLDLGHVYLRTSVETFAARASRYLAIGVVLVLAALLIAILGASNAAAAAANRQLQEQIAARERAESALRQAQKMEALGQLTGGVAHDFNNLLMAASSGLELMDRARTPDRRDRFKAGIRDAIDRGARLTQQLLAFSRRTPVQTEIVDVARHVSKLGDLLNHSLREDVVVRFDIEPGIWPIEVDASQLDVAILNLTVNARDAMPRGGEICITARNRPGALVGGDAVAVTIEDHGQGMTPEALERAFEPFYTTKEMGRGTGLGLSQVYGFARASRGEVTLSSVPGAGTTVTLLLPRCQPLADEREAVAEPGATRFDLTRKRVLLVEDDPSLNELVAQMLEELGAEVLRATSAADGLGVLANDDLKVDLVVSDMVMPGDMDGLDLARRVREERPGLPVVLMTGYSAVTGAAAEEGFPLLTKPFTIDALAGKLDSAGRQPGPGQTPAS